MRASRVHVPRGAVVAAAGFGPAAVAAYWTSVVYALYGVGEVADGWPEMIAGYGAVVLCGLTATVLWRQRNSRPVKTRARNPATPRRAALSARLRSGATGRAAAHGRATP